MAWRGSARAATTAPSQGKTPTTRQQCTAYTSTISRQGKAEQLEEKREVAMAETLGAGGDGAEGVGRQSTRSHRQAGAPSRDLSNAPHLDG
jgi:hypothetical protein